jgi:Flp pilus assembly protein TadD
MAYQYLDLSSIEFDIPIKKRWLNYYAKALIRLGNFYEALRIIQMIPAESALPMDYVIRAQIFTQKNQPDSLEQLIRYMENRGELEAAIFQTLYRITCAYAVIGDRINQEKWASKMLDWVKARPEAFPSDRAELAKAYYMTEDYKNALLEYQYLVQSQGEKEEYLMQLGCIHAKLGNREGAMECIQKLSGIEEKYSHGACKYGYCLLHEKIKCRKPPLI